MNEGIEEPTSKLVGQIRSWIFVGCTPNHPYTSQTSPPPLVAIYFCIFVKEGEFQYSYLTRGKVTGFTVFTLPLINAALFPVILAARNRPNFFSATLDRLHIGIRELLVTDDSEDYPYI